MQWSEWSGGKEVGQWDSGLFLCRLVRSRQTGLARLDSPDLQNWFVQRVQQEMYSFLLFCGELILIGMRCDHKNSFCALFLCSHLVLMRINTISELCILLNLPLWHIPRWFCQWRTCLWRRCWAEPCETTRSDRGTRRLPATNLNIYFF